MYIKIEHKTKIIETRTYKQLTKESLARVIKDIKKYCDDELMITFNKHSFDFIPIPQELIREMLLMEKEPGDYFINTNYRVFKRNPDYDPDYEEDEDNQELQTYWHTRWEDDYEGTYDTWEEYLEYIINDYIYKHEDEYEWETIRVVETVKDED